MGNAEYRSVEEREENILLDDPKYIEQPSRNAEKDHVIINLPRSIKIKPILKALCDKGYIEDESGYYEFNKKMVISCDDEKKAKMIIQYLNGIYGNIASSGYKTVVSTYYNASDYDTLGHITTVYNATAAQPNDQYYGYEKVQDELSGLPNYEKVDIERKCRFMRPHMAKQQKKMYKNRLQNVKPKPRVKENQFGVPSVTFNEKDGDSEQKAIDMRAAGNAMFSGGGVGGGDAIGKPVSPRKAVELDYTHKARKLRHVTRNQGLMKRGSNVIGSSIMNQFTRDHTRNLIRTKKKKWQLNRTKRIYNQQSDKRLEQTYLKQRYDPVAQKRRDLAAQTLWNRGGNNY